MLGPYAWLQAEVVARLRQRTIYRGTCFVRSMA